MKYIHYSSLDDWFLSASLTVCFYFKASRHPTQAPIYLARPYLCNMFIYFGAMPIILPYYTIFAPDCQPYLIKRI